MFKIPTRITPKFERSGWGGGGSHVACKKMLMSHVSVANKSLCPLSNLRNGNVACHYRFPPSCRVARAPCGMSNLRNGHVAVSNLVVQTHRIQMGIVMS